MKKNEISEALEPVIKTLDELNIPYCISGSLASSAYGFARATLDVDIVINIGLHHINPLISGLEKKFYVDPEMISNAFKRKSFFNILHLKSMLKIDFFVSTNDSYSDKIFERRIKDKLQDEADSIEIYLISPEDIILNKLVWYKFGGKVSEKQWADVIGVLKIQGKDLDMKYLKKWAEHLNVQELLKKAYSES